MTEAWPIFIQKLRAYIGRRVDASFVDDILGDILLRAAEHRDQFDSTDNPLAWLYHVAGNIIADHYRRRATEQKALKAVGAAATEEDSSSESDSYTELAQCLAPMIRQLPEDYREALLLTDIKGITQTAAAAQLDLSVSGMKSRVQRGREQLKQALRRCCEIEVNNKGRIVDYMQHGCADPCKKDCG
jgi:RNA polymerase sigma-70 factor, ECF subfamily